MPTALITGASRGIGAETARVFAKSGWDLLLVSKTEYLLQELVSELEKTNRKIFYRSIDLAKPDSIQPALRELLCLGLCPSVLINNAGVAWTGDLLTMPLDRWEWLMQVNLTSVYQVCSSVVPVMREKGGLVINVSSHASRHAFPKWGAYCTSKAALDAFTRCLAEEERGNGIRACTLTLGSVNTPLWDSETVQNDFDRSSMLAPDNVAIELLHLAQQPKTQLIEDLTLMPSGGAF